MKLNKRIEVLHGALAIRISESEAANLGLKIGDTVEVTIRPAAPKPLSAQDRRKLIEGLRKYRGKFNRDEANE